MTEQAVLAGDIGGTKTTLALFSSSGNFLRERTYKNSMFSSLQEVISTFLGYHGEMVARACLGVAGPVHDNRVRMTNLDWTIDGRKLGDHFAIDRVLLVNDLVATAAGAVLLSNEGLVTINVGRPVSGGTIGVLAPGTGLGQSFAIAVNKRMQPFPSEGGHSSYAPRTHEQIKLLEFMLKKRPHVSVEQVCSGMAIPDIYAYMTTCCPEPEWIREMLREADDYTPIIIHAANESLSGGPTCEPADRALHLFVDILADESANLALKVLATGGIYLGGGIPPRILSFFDREQFMSIFSRGVYKEMLADIPIHIIRDQKTALIGAREIAMADS